MKNEMNGEVYTVKNEKDFAEIQKIFTEIDNRMSSLVFESSKWDLKNPETTELGLDMSVNMQHVIELIPENIILENLTKTQKMEIFKSVIFSINNIIKKLSQFADIDLTTTANTFFKSCQLDMVNLFNSIKSAPVNLEKSASDMKREVFTNWLFSSAKLKEFSKRDRKAFSELEKKLKDNTYKNFEKKEAKDIVTKAKSMLKSNKGKKLNDVINNNLLPVVNNSVQMFNTILTAIQETKSSIYQQTNSILNENKKFAIIVTPFMKANVLLNNISQEFYSLFGVLAEGILNNLNMQSQNLHAYITTSQNVIQLNNKIKDQNNELFRLFNTMESSVTKLHTEAKHVLINLESTVQTQELEKAVNNTSELFLSNGAFVDSYINWWGENEFGNFNNALNSYANSFPLQGNIQPSLVSVN